MDDTTPFEQVARLLPRGIRQPVLSLPRSVQVVTEELRLRAGRPIAVTLPERTVTIPGGPLMTPGDLRAVLEIATEASAHTALERVRHGFITVQGGHRVGLCGTAVVREDAVHNLRELSSLNLRIARQIPGIGNDVLCQMRRQKALSSLLILAPPGSGKTTLLRDLIRGLSDGVGGPAVRVGVADERGEVGALYQGVPQFDLGLHTDVMDGCSKADGLMMLLRGMNPQVLAVDEITAPEDIHALEIAAGCGAVLLATAHGSNPEDLRRRPLYAQLLQRRIFDKVLYIERKDAGRCYRLEDLMC